MVEFETNNPEEGYPAGETEPLDDDVPSAHHPEDIDETPSDEEVTESPGGGPADPESGSV